MIIPKTYLLMDKKQGLVKIRYFLKAISGKNETICY